MTQCRYADSEKKKNKRCPGCSDPGEEPQIEAGWDLDGFQGDSGGCEHKAQGKDLLDVHQQCGTISSVVQSVLKQEETMSEMFQKASDYFFTFI